MNRIQSWAIATMFVGLAACGDEPPTDQAEKAGSAVTETIAYQERLRTMDEGRRNATFIRAIRDAEKRCSHVQRSAYQQEFNGMSMWTAHCTETGDWVLLVSANGSTQVLHCSMAQRAGLPACASSGA